MNARRIDASEVSLETMLESCPLSQVLAVAAYLESAAPVSVDVPESYVATVKPEPSTLRPTTRARQNPSGILTIAPRRSV